MTAKARCGSSLSLFVGAARPRAASPIRIHKNVTIHTTHKHPVRLSSLDRTFIAKGCALRTSGPDLGYYRHTGAANYKNGKL